MRVLLVSTYDLGRQPFGLASPAARNHAAGFDVDCADTSRDPLDEASIARAELVAFYLPMHTATRLAAPLIERVRRVNPAARLAAYGLYAPINADWLRHRGVAHVLGPEAEGDLVALASAGAGAPGPTGAVSAGPVSQPRLRFITPDRSTLPGLSRYATLHMPDGSRRTVGSTDATRGCKHLCRHCPIVPVYQGQFRVLPLEVILEDIAAQVSAGAEHVSFGDPDFLNGPTHARRVVEGFAKRFPGVSYDVTIKIEHLLAHAPILPLLRDTGCLFITSAVESIDDEVLRHLRKGHTHEDFVRAVSLCREVGITLSPTFVSFSPWTTLASYAALLGEITRLDLIEQVAPIQLAIRLLVTAGSPLLELPEIQQVATRFDPDLLMWQWQHPDPRVDALQAEVMRLVGANAGLSRAAVFRLIEAASEAHAGRAGSAPIVRARVDACCAGEAQAAAPVAVPYLDEPWYCCAEPVAEDVRLV